MNDQDIGETLILKQLVNSLFTKINVLRDEMTQSVNDVPMMPRWSKQPAGGDSTSWAFTPTVSGMGVSVREGVIQLGATNYVVGAGTVTLSGAVEYVYVYHDKNHSTSGFGHSSTLPDSAGDQWRWILSKYALSGSTYAEVWAGHRGNIIVGTPTA
jgi:hypothetical protein